MKLWDKGNDIDKWVEEFTVGKDRDLDIYLAKWDVIGSIAHARMLETIDLLSSEELSLIENELKNILGSITSGKFIIENDVEDVHSQVELILTAKLGDIGKKIHSGRSRNDQVLLDLKLYFRQEISLIAKAVNELAEVLLELAEKEKSTLMPGYTHMQIAMPSTFGLWYSSFAEGFSEDLHVLHAAWKVANRNPLGSAAGYGSSFPLDRKMTTRLLGFDGLTYNVIAAQAGRGKTEKFLAYSIASISSTLGRMAMDICTYSGQNYRFFKLPDNITTGSSIMPHKKNPDVFEILRGKCNRLQTLPGVISQMLTNLTTGYHRDLQLIKEEIVPGIEELKDCLRMATFAISRTTVNTDILKDPVYEHLFTVEEVNRLVLTGKPFRDAYKEVGQQLAEGSFKPSSEINHSHEGSLGNLCLAEIRSKIDDCLSGFNFDRVEGALEELLA